MRVSVIIPTYNRAAYLREALVSVFNQQLPPWEVIVIDDASEDNTADVVQAFAPGVRYIRRDGSRGISAARNHGLRAAHGDLLAWLDSDDLWEPDHLATVVALLTRDKSLDGAYTGIVHIDAEGKLLPQSNRWAVQPEDLFSSLVEACPVQTSSFVAHRRCFEQAGDFDTAFDICEDYDMFLRIAARCRIAGISDPSVRYRVHGHNTVKNVAAFCHYRIALMDKHFGPLGENLDTCSEERRRAHGLAFRAAALKCIESGQFEQGWACLKKGISIYPGMLGRLDTFYELALGDQPQGYRGAADRLDIAANGADLLAGLEDLFASGSSAARAWRGSAYGNAYLALGMLSDQAGEWPEARRYLLQAFRHDPKLLSASFLRRLLKLTLGPSVIKRIRSMAASGSVRHTGVTRA